MSQDHLTSKNRKQLDNIAADGFSKGSATFFFRKTFNCRWSEVEGPS